MNIRHIAILTILCCLSAHVAYGQTSGNLSWTYVYYQNIDREVPSAEQIIASRNVFDVLEMTKLQYSATAESSLQADFRGKTAGGSKYALGFGFDLSASGTAFVGPNFQPQAAGIQIEGRSSYFDHARLIGEGTIPFDWVTVNWLIDGNISHQLNGTVPISSTQGVSATIELRNGAGDSHLLVNYEHFRSRDADGVLTEHIEGVPGTTSALFGLKGDILERGFDVKTFFTALYQATSGSISVGYRNTAIMDSITFPDGSTPEQHGFQIVFDSGILSPNVAPVPTGVTGDYNNDGTVDAADFTVWRDKLDDEIASMPNEIGAGVDQEDYDVWRQHFGESLAANPNFKAGNTASVPEPTVLTSLLCIAIVRISRRVTRVV